MLREAPEGVPAAVIAAAYELDANLDKREDKKLLWRLVQHPDMPRVWRELRRRRTDGNGQYVVHDDFLAFFFRTVFCTARQPGSVTTAHDFLARRRSIAALARPLLNDAGHLLRLAHDDD